MTRVLDRETQTPTVVPEREKIELPPPPPGGLIRWIQWLGLGVLIAAIAFGVTLILRPTEFTAASLAELEDLVAPAAPVEPAFGAAALATLEDGVQPAAQVARFSATGLAELEDLIVPAAPAVPAFTATDLALLEDLVVRPVNIPALQGLVDIYQGDYFGYLPEG